jgi:hypothetical protein
MNNELPSDGLRREDKNTYLGKRFLNSEKAIEYLGISKSHLDKLCSQRVIRFHNPPTHTKEGIVKGKLRYFKVEDLNEFMTSYTNEPIGLVTAE